MQTSASKKANPVRWVAKYLHESFEELKKVTWPSKDMTVKYSVLVVGISLFLAVFLSFFDFLFTMGLEQLVKLTS